MTVWYYDEVGKPAFCMIDQWIFDPAGNAIYHGPAEHWYKNGVAKYHAEGNWIFSMSGEPSFYRT
ncbi:hypothetical protein [Paracoccus sp. PAMC 22219]|uniref:hypothetical protein n=1 Tax=Paracoccus sp. PAMC 22219 TaxID=1569209 RepID=UPI0012E09D63|nr:hypothetical protein [Paracoccus sp. PAMC 22219]